MTLQERLLNNEPLVLHLSGPHIYADRRVQSRPIPFIILEGETIHLYARTKEDANEIAEVIISDLIDNPPYRTFADATIQRDGRLYKATIMVNPCYTAQ